MSLTGSNDEIHVMPTGDGSKNLWMDCSVSRNIDTPNFKPYFLPKINFIGITLSISFEDIKKKSSVWI